jgi:hypothetical protein
MKIENLLLAGLAIGGLYLIMKKKKGAGTTNSTSKGGGGIGGGGIGGGMTSGIGNSAVGLNSIGLTANTPSMATCITNPSIIGCDGLLPSLVNAQVQGDVISQMMESPNNDTRMPNPSYEEDMGGSYEEDMGGSYEEAPTQDEIANPIIKDITGDGNIKAPIGDGNIKAPIVDTGGVKGDAGDVKDLSGDTKVVSGDTKVVSGDTKVAFLGNRVDGYFESQVSSSRRKGRKDKYDFDGEYSTFLDDSF